MGEYEDVAMIMKVNRIIISKDNPNDTPSGSKAWRWSLLGLERGEVRTFFQNTKVN